MGKSLSFVRRQEPQSGCAPRRICMIEVLEPASASEFDAVRDLMRSFIAWHRERHVDDLRLIDEYFDPVAFDQELRTLPAVYARPRGRLLLANRDRQPAGCVALRDIGDGYCEMKRM